MKICCVGITTLDRIFTLDTLPVEEGKYFASNFKEQGGGPAATAAVAIARLGAQADMIARVGDDATGSAIIKELQDEGVNTEHMIVIKGATSTQASIFVDKDGSRIIVSYPSKSLVPDASALEKVDFSAYDMVLADVRWPEGALMAFTLAQKAGVPTLLDGDITPQSIDELVKLSSHAVFSKPGLLKYANMEDPMQALRHAGSNTKGRVYVTLGADGYCHLDCDTIKHSKGFKVNVKDTTGAGDVFHGALAYALCDGMGTDDALRFAAAVAALKCTQPGGRSGIPGLEQVKKFCLENSQ